MKPLVRSYLFWGVLVGGTLGFVLLLLGVMRLNDYAGYVLVGGGSMLGLILGLLSDMSRQMCQRIRVRRLRYLRQVIRKSRAVKLQAAYGA